MRPRKKNRHLPACVYQKHGAYYLVRKGKWTRLGQDLPTALNEYARIMERPVNELGGLLDRFLEDKGRDCKPATLDQYRRVADVLRHAFHQFRIDQIQAKHVYQFMDHYRTTPNWANRSRTVLKQTMDRAVLLGWITANPVASVPRFKENERSRYVTDAEYRAIWEAANGAGYQGPHLAVIMDLAYLTAQRIGDVLAIQRQDLTEDGVTFRNQKTEKRVLVQWTPDLREAVDRALALQGETPKVYLLAQRNGRKRGYTGVRDLFERYAKKAGVSDVHLHDLRAKSITDAKEQGKDFKTLGAHATEAESNRYVRNKETLVAEGPSFRRFSSIGH